LRSGDAWQRLGAPLASSTTSEFSPQSLAVAGKDAYAAWIDVGGALHLARLKGSHWSRLPSPAGAGADVVAAELAADRKGVYLMWGTATGGGIRWHVARLR
jgi:hypothetical protein